MVIAVDKERSGAYKQITSKKDYKPRYKMIYPVRTEEEKAKKVLELMVASRQYQVASYNNED
tara:strand:- start:2503 stop:2688 length:186 start_codon:yes stop_codon:yes gene_type:complete